MAGSRRWVQAFSRYPCANWYKNFYWISISIRPIFTKFGKQVYIQDLNQIIFVEQMLWRHNVKMTWQTKINNLQYYNIYDHKNRQYYDLPWLSFTHKVKWPPNHVFLLQHVTNWKHCTSTTTMLMSIKRGRMMTYLE